MIVLQNVAFECILNCHPDPGLMQEWNASIGIWIYGIHAAVEVTCSAREQ